MSSQQVSAEREDAIDEVAQIGEFYAGWNAAIRAVQEKAKAEGWWFPESTLKLLVKP
jgi:hypothetical protein